MPNNYARRAKVPATALVAMEKTSPARPGRNGFRSVEATGVLPHVVLAAFFLAVASPSPAPAPRPTPTNPFNLNPIPLATTLPIIGTTRAKPVCTAIRRVVAPAVVAAMKNDKAYADVKAKIYDYVLRDSEEARDLHLTQMDHQVNDMVKNIDDLEAALKSPLLDIPATAKPEDAKTLRDLRTTLHGVLAAQKFQENALSGFVETERMRRFGQLSESEQNMQKATGPNVVQPGGGGALQTPAPLGAFLRDTQTTFNPQHRVANGLHDAKLLDQDLNDIAAVTSRYEDAATKVIVPAANACK